MCCEKIAKAGAGIRGVGRRCVGSLFLLQVCGDKLLRAHYADLPRLAHTRAMAAFAPARTPMIATPPARVFAATNMLVCVLLLLLLCAERLFPLPVSQGDTDFSSE